MKYGKDGTRGTQWGREISSRDTGQRWKSRRLGEEIESHKT